MEQEPVNDNMDDGPDAELGWHLKGPDADGDVWLVDVRGETTMINLGPFDLVGEVLADWLAQQDFGER